MPLIRKDAPQAPKISDAADALRMLTKGTEEERWTAARGLAKPEAVSALGAAVAGEASARVRGAIFTSLARIATLESVDALVPYLRSDDSNVRTGALDALRAAPQASLLRLPDLLRDRDADVRLLACEIARGLPAEDATALLGDVLRHDDEVNVCASAIDVLAEMAGPEALPALSACAARFPNEPFLIFAIEAAADRIRASASS